ncbi:hypothetical protein DL239_08535 [Sedimentitalea sp. CY04]|uniref:NAD glycohydrolase translocation F5/8 type C domain-containing protein n=1 Tax=Parasedimentitalea denitrificans TaxID=2211118 RepID=A0ABX0W9N8_9RHOB|nr:hypothetical protein [Sedimentitalea sp. CY04]NIZ61020.1 hypothetical protein [Sedimentitalea sp. CY04]
MRILFGLFAFCMAIAYATQDAAAETCVKDAWYPGSYNLCVSSVLPPQGKNTYGPGHLSFQREGGAAWCEGVKGNGVGQTISFQFLEGAQKVSSFDLLNGYQKSDKHFRTNGRIRRVALSSNKGPLGVFDVHDVKYTSIDFPEGRYKWLKLEVLSVYPGTKYQDVCITGLAPM